MRYLLNSSELAMMYIYYGILKNAHCWLERSALVEKKVPFPFPLKNRYYNIFLTDKQDDRQSVGVCYANSLMGLWAKNRASGCRILEKKIVPSSLQTLFSVTVKEEESLCESTMIPIYNNTRYFRIKFFQKYNLS